MRYRVRYAGVRWSVASFRYWNDAFDFASKLFKAKSLDVFIWSNESKSIIWKGIATK